MDKIFAESEYVDNTEIIQNLRNPIQPASYDDSEEWVQQYQEQFCRVLSFF